MRRLPALALVVLVLAVVALSALMSARTAEAADIATLESLRDGSLKKLVFSEPKPVSEVVFTDLDAGSHSLADYEGKVVVLNFWATWCAPCRKEMPALDALQAEYGGEEFQVVTVATGRNSPTGLTRFFEDENIQNLPLLTDPKQALARDMAVLGLPVTVLIDRDGNEIARLMGDADWNGDSARAIVQALIENDG